jgi:hypothetical protein
MLIEMTLKTHAINITELFIPQSRNQIIVSNASAQAKRIVKTSVVPVKIIKNR